MTPAPPPSRIPELDALRGIASLAVLLYHYTDWFPHEFGPWADQVLPRAWWGYYGVELFFVISGFVVFWTAERAGSLRAFAASRAGRLFPAYWAAIAIAAPAILLDPLNTVPKPSVLALMVNATLLQSFVGVRPLVLVFWTLAYEIAFYAWIALIVIVLRRGQRIEMFALGWIGFALGVRLSDVALPYRVSVATMLYFGQFFIIGLCLFRLSRGQGTAWTWAALVASLGVTALGGPPGSPAGDGSVYLPAALVCAAMVWIAVRHRPAILRAPVLLWLGAISYPLYLVHVIPGYTLLRHLRLAGWGELPSLGAATILSLLLATVIQRLVERPLGPRLRALLAGQRARPPRLA